MTLAEYFETQESVLPHSLIDGIVHVADAPFVPHQRVVLRLATALLAHTDQTHVGEVFIAPIDVVLDPDAPLVLQPDIAFVSAARSRCIADRIYGPPDMVVEVLSPFPRIGDLNDRLTRFARHGVEEVWLYDQPSQQLHILGCRDGVVASRRMFDPVTPIASAVLPGFTPAMCQILP
jgi:Uma2 family endonuclease